LFCLSAIQAQWDAPFSHYWAVRGFYNPAFAGETDQIRTAAVYRYQWAGIDKAPQKVVVTADMPVAFFQRRHGAGIVASSEQAGSLRNTLLAGQYSFRQEFGKGALQLGLQAGISNLQYDAGSLQFIPGEEPYERGILRVNPADKQQADLNAGIAWSGKHIFAGLSVLHLTEPGFSAVPDSITAIDLQSDSTRSFIPRSWHLMAGYNIGLFSPLEIQPMVRVQSDLSVTQVQATLRLEYYKRFSGGVSWLSDDGYAFFAGATLQGLELGYAYSLHTSGIGNESNGSHEFYLRYNFPLDYFKPKLQPQKSIRLL
jgi:type IX secretion system PorP/SprF family membrane protein